MPRRKRDYSRGKIYEVVNSKNPIKYIGSTISTLVNRMSQHRVEARNGSDKKFAKAMRELSPENFKMKLIRNFPCNSKKELEAEENREMKKYPKEMLYNDIFDGKASEETKLKRKKTMAAKPSKTEEEKKIIGDKISKSSTHRGSISLSGNRYEFSWSIDKVRHREQFSKKQYGSLENAKQAAIDFQNIIYPLEESKEEKKVDDNNPYSKGKIYKVYNDVNDILYIGSTISLLCRQLSCHKNNTKRCNSKFYKAMKTIGKDRFKISLIREVKCNDADELIDEEFKEIAKHNPEKLYNTTLTRNKKPIYYARWCFDWSEEKDGESVKGYRSFSTSKYGKKGAKQLAINLQNKIFPLDRKDQRKHRSNFKRGCIYLSECFKVHYVDDTGKKRAPSFSVKKFGYEGARQKAMEILEQTSSSSKKEEKDCKDSKDTKSSIDSESKLEIKTTTSKRKYNNEDNNSGGDDSSSEDDSGDDEYEDDNKCDGNDEEENKNNEDDEGENKDNENDEEENKDEDDEDDEEDNENDENNDEDDEENDEEDNENEEENKDNNIVGADTSSKKKLKLK